MTDYPFAILVLLLQVPLLVGEGRNLLWLRAPVKILASACFILQAWWSGALDVGPVGTAVFVGLCLSAVGDVMLLSRSKAPFLVGIGAFLLAHLAYTWSFASLHPRPLLMVIALVPLSIASGFVWRWLAPGLGNLQIPVVMYMAAITTMVALAVAAVATWPTIPRGGMLAAALLFWLSDLTVARDRFSVHSEWNRYIGLPLYYVAQVGFAAFVVAAASV